MGGIEGIVNGMDTSEWCPTQDKFLDVKYDEETVAEGKGAPPSPRPHPRPVLDAGSMPKTHSYSHSSGNSMFGYIAR